MIILGSGSPRRRMLLESAGIEVHVEAADIDESHHNGESPKAYAERMAREKAAAVLSRHEGGVGCIIAADTSVVHDGVILGKPQDKADAYRMLRGLSGDVHSVLTGVCVIDLRTQRRECFVSETRVYFTELSDVQVNRYIDTGEPMDKAGAYGIQGGAAGFVSHVEGSYTNVVGLPLCETLAILRKMGYYE